MQVGLLEPQFHAVSTIFSMFVCFGSALMDIIAEVADDFLDKYNLKANSSNASDENAVQLFQDLDRMNAERIIGGSITNTARLLRANLRNETIKLVYVTTIGKDEDGKTIKAKLEEEHITCAFKELDLATGKCGVLISNPNRTLYTHLGASKIFTMEDLKEKSIWQYIEQCQYLYFSAFYLRVSWDCMKCVLDYGKDNGKKILFNLGAAFIFSMFPRETLEIISGADIIFGNEDELNALCSLLQTPYSSIEENALHVDSYKNHNGRIMIVTRAEEPVILIRNGKIQYFPVPRVEQIVDTNGAGDAFVAGFTARYMEGESLESCVECGLNTAAKILGIHGCNLENITF